MRTILYGLRCLNAGSLVGVLFREVIEPLAVGLGHTCKSTSLGIVSASLELHPTFSSSSAFCGRKHKL